MTAAFLLRVPTALLGFAVASIYGIGITLIRRDRSRVARDYAQMLARLMRPPLGLQVEVEGEHHLREHLPCIYIANHQSAYDVPVLAGIYPPDTVIIGKKELKRIPFFGWLYVVTGNILIDRSNTQHAVGRLREAEEAILERGVSVWIFPEGTRGRVPGRLLPFKKGAFQMALATGAPLVPVVVAPLAHLFNVKRGIARPGIVRVRILEPFSARTSGATNLPSLMEEAQSRMQGALDELTREVEEGLIAAGEEPLGTLAPSRTRSAAETGREPVRPGSHKGEAEGGLD